MSALKKRESQFCRLKAVFDTHSGVPRPNPYDDAGAYAHQLKAAFLDDLNRPIAEFVKKHLVGWRTRDFAKVRDHAVHTQEVIKEGGRGRERLRGRGGRADGCFVCVNADHWERTVQTESEDQVA